MRLVFMGTPDFAVPSLKALAQSRHSVVLTITAPDKPRGRGQVLLPTPVKEAAQSLGIPVYQPDDLKATAVAEKISSVRPDLIVVVAFKILPPAIFTIPPKGSFNLHASLLPKYRGAAPIQWALIRGEKETGVTTFLLREKVDTGSILLQRTVAVEENETAGELHDKLAVVGAEVVVETVERIDSGSAKPMKQDDSLATDAPKIFKEICRIDWTLPSRTVHNFIRGLSPAPAAYTTLRNEQLKILRTVVVSETGAPGKPGVVLESKGETLTVACGNGSIRLLEIQPASRKRMTAGEYLRGYILPAGAKLG